MTDKPTDPAFYMARLDEALADTFRRMNEQNQKQWTPEQIERAKGSPAKPINMIDPKVHDIIRAYRTKADSDGDDGA